MANQYNESERGRYGRGAEDYRRVGRSQQERGYEGRDYDERGYANRGEMRAFFGDDDYERRDEGQWGERRFGRGESYGDNESRERAYPRSDGRDYEWSGGNMGREYGGASERNWRQGNGGYGNEYSSRSRESWLTPGPYTGHGPQGYRRADERIAEDVNERLTQHGQLDASQIQVKVKDGEVTLTGTVNDRYAKRWAEDIVESCSGVKDVQNQLRVKQESQSFSSQQNQGTQHNQAEMKRAAKQ